MASVSGGDKFGLVLSRIAEQLSSASAVEVGFLENSTYPNGTPTALVAAIQEFGAPKAHVPPRPYFRSMIAAKKGEWPEAMAGLMRKYNYNARQVLAQTGMAIKGQLQQSIVDTNSPPLSAVTLMLRKMKADDPDLVVTGRTVGEAAARVAAGEVATVTVPWEVL